MWIKKAIGAFLLVWCIESGYSAKVKHANGSTCGDIEISPGGNAISWTCYAAYICDFSVKKGDGQFQHIKSPVDRLKSNESSTCTMDLPLSELAGEGVYRFMSRRLILHESNIQQTVSKPLSLGYPRVELVGCPNEDEYITIMGDTKTCQCRLKKAGNPPGVAQWLDEDRRLVAQWRKHMGQDGILFLAFDFDDLTPRFTCRGSSPLGHGPDVFYKPMFVFGPELLTENEIPEWYTFRKDGACLEIKITITSVPEPGTFTLKRKGWLKVDEEIDKYYYDVTYEPLKHPTGVLFFTMAGLTDKDDGQYMLTIDNGIKDELDYTFDVNVPALTYSKRYFLLIIGPTIGILVIIGVTSSLIVACFKVRTAHMKEELDSLQQQVQQVQQKLEQAAQYEEMDLYDYGGLNAVYIQAPPYLYQRIVPNNNTTEPVTMTTDTNSAYAYLEPVAALAETDERRRENIKAQNTSNPVTMTTDTNNDTDDNINNMYLEPVAASAETDNEGQDTGVPQNTAVPVTITTVSHNEADDYTDNMYLEPVAASAETDNEAQDTVPQNTAAPVTMTTDSHSDADDYTGSMYLEPVTASAETKIEGQGTVPQKTTVPVTMTTTCTEDSGDDCPIYLEPLPDMPESNERRVQTILPLNPRKPVGRRRCFSLLLESARNRFSTIKIGRINPTRIFHRD